MLQKLAKLELEIQELKRRLSEAEAQAHVAGYQESRRDCEYGRLHSYFFECIKKSEPRTEQLSAKAA